MDVIKIYNPNEWPYGKLSNNAIHQMKIDNTVWNTVTNFIYANTLNTPIYRMALMSAPIKGDNRTVNIEDKVKQIVANIELGGEAQFKGYGAPIYGGLEYARKIYPDEVEKIRHQVIYDVNLKKMDIYQLHNHYLGLEYVNIVTKAVETAYHTLLDNNVQLQQILLNTGNRPILYNSGNNVLGIGNGNENGSNVVGNTLMQIRHEIVNKDRMQQSIINKQTLEGRIFIAYIVKYILEKELSQGVDIEERYGGMTPEEILASKIKMFETREAVLRYFNVPESMKPYAIKMYNMGKLPIIEKEFENPGSMAKEIKKQNIDEFKEIQRQTRNKVILRFYVIYQLKTMNPNIDEKEIEMGIDEFMAGIPSVEDYENLAKRVAMLYFTGGLPENVATMIHEGLVEGKIDEENFDEEPPSSSSTSSSLTSYEEDDEIANNLSNDRKSKRKFFISELSKFSGKNQKYFRGWTLANLQKKYNKYMNKPDEDAGKWIVELKNRDNTKELLKEFDHRPTDKDISKLVKKYNEHNERQIKSIQLVVRFKKSEFNKGSSFQENENEKEKEKEIENKQEIIEGHVKNFGDPLYLNPIVENNEPFMGEFSPLFVHNLNIDGFSYNTISSYLTTILLTQTGIVGDVRNKGIFKRGRPVKEARSLILDKNGNFLPPQEAGEVYMQENLKTHQKLINILAHVGIKKKFEDSDLQYILKSTGKKYLQWNDPNDIYLGGEENLAGKIWMEIRSSLKLPKLYVNKESLPDIVLKDGFIKEWIRMQLSDMCSTVGKLKCYIWKTSKIDEDIDKKFVETILNQFYSPSENLSNIAVEIPVPPFFVSLVEECFGMKTYKETNYFSQILELQNKIQKAEAVFWGYKFSQDEPKKKKFLKFLQDANKVIESKKLSGEKLQDFKDNFQLELDSYFKTVKVKQPASEVKRKKWLKFLENLNRPILSYEEIYRKMDKFNKKLYKKYKDELEKERTTLAEIQDRIALEKLIQKERAEYWNTLLKPELDENERRKAIDEYIEKQKDETQFPQLANISSEKRKEAFEDLESKLKGYVEIIKQKIEKLTMDLNKANTHHRLNLHGVAKVYWNRICILLGFFTLTLGSSYTVDKVHRYLIDIQNTLSQPTKCEVITPLFDTESNCIASALINLLIKLQNFKYKYCECPMSEEDIDICASIILDTPITKSCRIPKKTGMIEEVKDFNIKDVENEDEKDEDDSAPKRDEEIIDSTEDEEEEKEEDEENRNEGEYADEGGVNDENDDEFFSEEQEEQEEEALFGMSGKKDLKSPKEQLEPIKMLLYEINDDNSEERSSLAKHFLKTVELIKKAKNKKQNRINFFATLIK